jgi:hypothetical protein
MSIFNRLLSNKRKKIIAIVIGVFILDLAMSIWFVLDEKRMYNSDRDEFYFKLEGLFLWMFLNLSTIFGIVFLGLIFIVIVKKVVKFIKWILS